MATRNPLVLVDGSISELPAGDTLAGVGGGGGSAVTYEATVTVAPARYGTETVNVVDAGVSPTSKIMCQLTPNSEWDADDLFEISVMATPLAGSIDFCICRNGPIVGSFDILYTVG